MLVSTALVTGTAIVPLLSLLAARGLGFHLCGNSLFSIFAFPPFPANPAALLRCCCRRFTLSLAKMLCAALAALGALRLASASFAAGAPRYYPVFGGNRAVSLLDGEWDYDFVDGWDSGFDSMSPTFKPSDATLSKKTAVPSCSDVVAGGAPGYLGPRGVAMYRTGFDTLNSRSGGALPVRLQFQSCSFYCRIWVNGEEVQPPQPEGLSGPGHRGGGYVAFFVDVPAKTLKAGGSNELFVLADNRFNHTTAPLHTGGDFWHYGGLTRSVELHTLQSEGPVLWRAYVLPTGTDFTLPSPVSHPDSVDITLVLSSAGDAHATDKDGPVEFTVAFDGGKATSMKGTAKDGQVSLKKVPVPNPTLWSPDSPNLHNVTVTYRGGSVTERFGLRSLGVDKESARVTINGKVTKLVGWNHHTQWPVTAASPTDEQMDADIALLKKGNANYVRGAHYPHDPRMIDRFDEAGILFWSETLGPSVSLENMQDWDFFVRAHSASISSCTVHVSSRSCEESRHQMKFQLQQLEQMLDNAMNHASILTWGWFNEGPSSEPKACPAYAANAKYLLRTIMIATYPHSS